MRLGSIILLGAISVSACHGAPITEVDSGSSPGHGGSSGAVGTGAAGTGTAGTGTAATGGRGGATGGRGGNGGTTPNACMRCDTPCTDGICELAIVRTSQNTVDASATSVALNNGRLYFVAGNLLPDGVQVLSIATGGGQEMELYPHHDCSNCQLTVAVDDADVFFAGQNAGGTNAILAVPKGGGNVRTVCTTPDAFPSALTLEGNYVYYVRVDEGIERCPKAGGSTAVAATFASAQATAEIIRMSSRPGAVVFGDGATGVVRRLDTNMLTTKTIGITANPQPTTPDGVCDAVDDGTLAYWILCGWNYSLYAEASVNNPTPVASALGGGDPNAIFDEYGSVGLDGGYIYFTEAGLLNRVPKGGGTVDARARLKDGQGYDIKALIVGFDDTYVYLARANTGDGAIYRVAK